MAVRRGPRVAVGGGRAGGPGVRVTVAPPPTGRLDKGPGGGPLGFRGRPTPGRVTGAGPPTPRDGSRGSAALHAGASRGPRWIPNPPRPLRRPARRQGPRPPCLGPGPLLVEVEAFNRPHARVRACVRMCGARVGRAGEGREGGRAPG